jgi:hypothetical protein
MLQKNSSAFLHKLFQDDAVLCLFKYHRSKNDDKHHEFKQFYLMSDERMHMKTSWTSDLLTDDKAA